MNKSDSQKSDNSAGVSEIIGAVLLISLVVVSIGIVAMLLFSQTSTPTKIPNMNFMTGVSADQHTLYLSHTGGDTLNLNEFSVLLDGQAPASPPTVSGGGSQWSLGTTLIVPISTVPQNVQIVYNSSGSAGAVLLRQASNVNTTVNVSADQIPYLDCSAVRNWDCATQIPSEIIIAQYMANSSVQKTNFMKNNIISAGGLIGKLNSAQYHFNFTVSEANSSIAWGDSDCSPTTKANLQVNDRVGIFFRSNAGPDDFILFGMAPMVWEMAGGGLSEIGIDITYASNGTTSHITGSRLCHTWISEYTDLDSTILIIGASSGSSYTALNVNNSFYIDGQDSSNITLVNFRPVPNGMFLVSWGGSATTPIFVVGWEDQIIKDGVVLTGAGL